MNQAKEKLQKRDRRRGRIRAKISGSATQPRISVFRSNKGMFVQLIDDAAGKTIVSVHTREIKSKGKKEEISLELGKLLAQKAKEKNISEAVFDRGGYKYHGRVKAVADGAREGGLAF